MSALLSDMVEHDGWKPNLKRLETLTDAAQMDQRDYAESWAWVYFMLHSPPERREILTSYLADVRAKGSASRSRCGWPRCKRSRRSR